MQRISNDLFEAIRAVTHPVLAEAKLDPVGKEDADVNNDDEIDKSDDYLKNRRKAISASIKKEEVEQADEAAAFDPMKHITDPQKKKELAPYAKLVDRGSYAQRAAMNKAGGVKDDRGPRGVTQEELDEGKMDKMTLSGLWHRHGNESYHADQGYGVGAGSMKNSSHAATAIENHVRKHYGNKVADDMVSHSDHSVAHAEYAGPGESEHHEKEAEKLRKKHGITGTLHGESYVAKQVAENTLSSKAGGMGADLGSPGKNFSKISKAAAKKYGKQSAGSLLTKMRKEEAELDEGVSETIVKHNDFTIEITDNPTFGDFLRAVQSIVRTDEEAAQAELISIAEQAFKENDDEVIIESFTRMEIQDKINAHRKAGNTVSDDKYSTKGGQPYAEYVVTDSEGSRKKYIHHGSVRRLESLPPAKKAK